MKITFLGGADEVGASCSLVEIAGKLILVDAGIRISPRSSYGIQNSQLPDLQPISALGGPDFILVTHAHTDHTGALPLVLEAYPQVPVIATQATQVLTRVLQLDAQRIMKTRHEQEGELPLFDEISVQRLMDAFQTIEFNQPLKLGEGLQLTYYTAGHIAGAACLALESSEGTLVISGDISKSEQRTVKSVVVPPIKADALILESTYGGRLHANRVGEEKRLMQNLRRITERGGKVLIPAFALGRAQEVLQIILAHRRALDVPVYVDGMVRTVCDAYQSFGDILPPAGLRMAGERHLFFRERVRPIRSNRHRLEIAASTDPLVVVASSGMLTGGASVVYARHFAPDPLNAILMTGYQDEEAPGRFLQRMMNQRQSGETPTLRLDDAVVKVRCEIDTYSLSAHADEMELLSFAEALRADDIMLVHGDPAARYSLAAALRQRGKSVTTPRIGQTKTFNYRTRPWALSKTGEGAQSEAVNLQQLWQALQDRAGDFFSLRELAGIWWGTTERIDELKYALQSDRNVYFSPNWRSRTDYLVRSPQQVRRSQRCQAIMLANPDLIGKLIVLRNSNGQVRLGRVNGADIDSFEATVHHQRGSRYPADALLWVIGDWVRTDEKRSLRSQLAALMDKARRSKDALLPFSRRQELVRDGRPVLPQSLLPALLPAGMDKQLALTGIVVALAEDGATLEREGLLPHRAIDHGPIEQNEAREMAMQLLPKEAYLRKVGMDMSRRRLILTFDFPATVRTRFGRELDELVERSGWDIYIKPAVNQQALGIIAHELLPARAEIRRGPSFHLNKGQVNVELANISEADAQELRQRYREITGFDLIVHRQIDRPSPAGGMVSEVMGSERLEINAAYARIRDKLEGSGLSRTSLKQGQIVLTFISPQVGERYRADIEQLAQETGYSLCIHPHPNQHLILQTAQRMLREKGWLISRGPGIHVDRAELRVSLVQDVPQEEIDALNERLLQRTGFGLVVER